MLAFPDKAALILPYHEDSMQTLRGALAAGAAPIGLAGVVLESPTTALFYTRAFAEIANDVRVAAYLEKQMQVVAHAAGLPPTITSMTQRPGWL